MWRIAESAVRLSLPGFLFCLFLGADPALSARDLKLVIVELFTSEGCSSCPPADRLLLELARQQPVAGVRIVPLGQHVDYWDRLGWKDPFSDALFSARQRELAGVMARDQIYTPQLVIQGSTELVGSQRAEAVRQIREAAAYIPIRVEMEAQPVPRSGSRVTVVIRIRDFEEAGTARYRLRLAVTEDNLETKVPRGENAGRRLKHAAVTRFFQPLGTFRAGPEPVQKATSVELDPSWKRQDLTLVAFVEDLRSLRIVGAAVLQLSGESF